MEAYQEKIILTLIVVVMYFITTAITFKIIDKTSKKLRLVASRGTIVKKIIRSLTFFLGIIIISLFWGVDHSKLAVFISSVLTIIGVAFFAQWSLLSNITSSIIIFFNHPIRLNDSISILEGKDYVIEGEVIDIGIFFITLRTQDGEELTLPNNVFVQKIIKKLNK